MGWRNCVNSVVTVNQVNAKWPNRDKASDGTIGDESHASRDSDHNPWVIVNGQGVVRARDIDKDGVDIAWMFEEMRKLAARGDIRLAGGGYLIFNRRITTPDFTKWVPYYGINPHDKHGHISWSRNQSGFDSASPWSFFGGPAVPPGAAPVVGVVGDKMAQQGEKGSDVAWIQQRLNVWGVSCNVDADFGPKTTAAVKTFQTQRHLTADGIVGPRTRDALNVSPAPKPAPRPTLRKGSTGAQVKVLQERLSVRYPSYRHEHGVLKVDGDFGSITEAWVKEFQGRVGLLADGIVGPRTWGALGL